MLTDRIRVLPPFDSRGTVIYHGGVGGVVGYANYALISNELVEFFFPLIFSIPFARIILFALGMSIPTLLAWRLARRTHRWRLIFACGFAYGALVALAGQVPAAIDRPAMWGAGFPYHYALFTAAYAVVVGVSIAALFCLVALVFLSIRYRIVAQDGTLCWACGYIVGNPPISERCPECGTVIEEPTGHGGAIIVIRGWMKRVARGAAVIALIASLIVVGRHGFREQASYQPFFSGVPNDGTLAAPMLRINRTANPITLRGGWEGVGVWRAISGHPDKVIVILYDPEPEPSQPAMQLQLMASPAASGFKLPMTGSEFIVCDLSPKQAHHVLDEDVPAALIEAMLDAAAAANWRPVAGGGFVGFTEVRAQGHFPEDAASEE